MVPNLLLICRQPVGLNKRHSSRIRESRSVKVSVVTANRSILSNFFLSGTRHRQQTDIVLGLRYFSLFFGGVPFRLSSTSVKSSSFTRFVLPTFTAGNGFSEIDFFTRPLPKVTSEESELDANLRSA
jgi:hypothetical protein